MRALARKERDVTTLPERSFTVEGVIVREPTKRDHGNYGYIQWAGHHVFVGEKVLKPFRAVFKQDSIVQCKIVWDESRQGYQVERILSAGMHPLRAQT